MTCQHCKGIKDLMISCKMQGSFICRTCNTERCKRYRKTKQGKVKIKEAVYRSIKKHKQKQEARVLLNLCVSRGIILKPKKCEECGNAKKLQAHHPDYSKPISVLWLCMNCHCFIHKKML